jgi:hypothetical protein
MAGNPIAVQQLQAQPGSVPASSLFGLPGVTQWTEQKENLDGTVTVLSTSSQVDALFASNFKQTDIVFSWNMEVTITQTYTAGGATFTVSALFPYNWIGPVGLNFQNQFDTLNQPGGYQAAILQMIRPAKFGFLPQVIDQNNFTSLYGTQTNQTTQATAYTAASATVKFTLDLQPGILFNLYYDLEEDGRLYSHKAVPIKAWVTPQLMSGTNRVIAPRVRFNSALATTGADTVPVTSTGGTPTFSGQASLGFRRKGIYQTANQNDTPPVFNWQYSRDFRRFSLSSLSSVDIAVPQIGQILCLVVQMWDPTLNSNVGGPIPTANVKECDLIYGSGLFKYQDTAQRMQNRFTRQHGILPNDGLIIWDMAISDDGLITNAMALNTLTTSGCTIHIDFTAQQNAGAYCNLLIEALRYVSVG